MAPSKVSLKLLIDKKGERVVFAEAGKDFVDLIFTLLALPIGPVIKLLNNNTNTVGSVDKFYESISLLRNEHIQCDQEVGSKRKYLSSSSSLYMPVGDNWWSPSPTPTTGKYIYRCSKSDHPLFSDVPNRSCHLCNNKMIKTEIHYVIPTVFTINPKEGLTRFMIMDDLVVTPWSNISSISLLSKFNIKDASALEEKDVQIGMDEGLKLLKHAMGSKRVLTNLFLDTEE